MHTDASVDTDSSDGGVSEGSKFVQAGTRPLLRSTSLSQPDRGVMDATCIMGTYAHVWMSRPRTHNSKQPATLPSSVAYVGLWASPPSHLGGCGH